MKISFGLSLLLIAATASPSAIAQETIFDPENPAVQGVDEEDEGDESEDDGEETIFDPENPAVSGDEDSEASRDMEGEGESVDLAEPRLEPIDEEPVQPTNAAFLGAYATSLGVDTAWEGRDEDIVEWANELELRLEYDMSGQSRAVVEGEFFHWMVGKENPDETDLLFNASRGRASYEPRLGEAYVLLREDNVSFRVGNLVTPWGSTDIVRPGDVVNPRDLTRIETVTATSDLLLPQFTAELAYSASDWSITGLLVPFFEENEAFVFGRDFALINPFNPVIGDQLPILLAAQELIDRSRWDDVQSFFAATRVPDEIPKNVSLGARATATAWNTDFGLGYFYGWDRTPWLELDEDLRELFRLAADDGRVLEDFDLLGFAARNPQAIGLTASVAQKVADGEEVVATEYRRRHTLVADVARYIGPIGVRADVVFSPEQTFYSDDFDPLRRTTLFGALGFSWERFESEDDFLAVTVEGFWLHPFDRDSAINEAFVAADERGPEDAQILLIGDDLYGAAAALQWTVPLIDADLQLGALGTLSTEDVVATASLGKRWFSWLNTTVAVTVLEGPDPSSDEPVSLGGLYDHNDQLTLTVDGVF
ncbi:hypothetical protein FIV42_22335 [Persicimonas caeni]|uniref:DUF1302 domain-containing protein n=1 Tax=Persicimonas caeni TaxID=2292766 RepID=A0A4Y6PYJ4_PERCE|nr:DUF1302 family protein [Persicimonas caeni]QDG53381.1 hypothetical protein FIV42_22335 [Persicimonas caeni]QED34602.1 hypothetical protein FRD00_22330 [Persicimonas caeni]